MKKIQIVLLAAGNSTRFGEAKLLADYHGKPMMIYALTLAATVKDNLHRMNESAIKKMSGTDKTHTGAEITGITVVSAHEQIRAFCDKMGGISYIENLHSEWGISYSIRLALENLQCTETDAVLFMVCDQPELSAKSVTEMIGNYADQEKPLACMYHEETGEVGNPCIFAKDFFSELLKLSGDVGGRKILRQHMEQVYLYQIEDANELCDIDTKTDILV